MEDPIPITLLIPDFEPGQTVETTIGQLAAVSLRPHSRSWGEATVKAAKIADHLSRLADAAQDLGHWPTQAELAELWAVTERTISREWSLFRLAFPGSRDPEEVVRWIVAQRGWHRVENPADLLAVPVVTLEIHSAKLIPS